MKRKAVAVALVAEGFRSGATGSVHNTRALFGLFVPSAARAACPPLPRKGIFCYTYSRLRTVDKQTSKSTDINTSNSDPEAAGQDAEKLISFVFRRILLYENVR